MMFTDRLRAGRKYVLHCDYKWVWFFFLMLRQEIVRK